MVWKSVINTSETIGFEQSYAQHSVRIEARKLHDEWTVIKKHIGRDVDIVEEYSAPSKIEAKKLLNELKKERNLSLSQMKSIDKLRQKKIFVDIQRAFKEENVEKWTFTIDNKREENALILHISDYINIDFMIHEDFRYIEERIIDECIRKLGLMEIGLDINYKVYYFRKSTNYVPQIQKDVLFDEIQVEFDEGSLR